MNKQKRVLLKLSGEQLAGNDGQGIDLGIVKRLAKEIEIITKQGIQIVVVPGAGNWIRGATFAGHGLERATADYMGMLAGVINGQALMDIFQSMDIPTRSMSSINVDQVSEPYIRRKAVRHLEKGRVVIITAGMGRPFFTHDTAGVSYALELDCEVVLKASNVEGVYDKDPNKFDDAKLFDRLTLQEAIEQPDIKVMDKAAIGLAAEQKMPIVVFDVTKEGNLVKAAMGENIGTTIS